MGDNSIISYAKNTLVANALHCNVTIPVFHQILCLLQNRGVSRVLPKPENLRSVQIFQKHPASCLSSVFRQLYVPVLFRTTPHLGWQLSLSTVHVEWQILRIVILKTVSLLSRRLPSQLLLLPAWHTYVLHIWTLETDNKLDPLNQNTHSTYINV